jgi:hypothetical protein
MAAIYASQYLLSKELVGQMIGRLVEGYYNGGTETLHAKSFQDKGMSQHESHAIA